MRFNSKPENQSAPAVNHEGAPAWTLTPELELYTAAACSGLSDTFYETKDGRVERIRALIGRVDPGFVARLAVYLRESLHLRTMPLFLTVELARSHRGDSLVSNLVSRVVQRADEITELLACYRQMEARTGMKKLNRLSKQLQKGLARSFNRFDEYQFAKYNRAAEIRLRDALFLVHPKPATPEQQEIFDRIASDTLNPPYTWEVELSVLGQQAFDTPLAKTAAFRAKWEELIDSGKLGYMALLRNLRNLLEADISSRHLDKICGTLADPVQVARSRQFPFRFLAAWRELKELNHANGKRVMDALEKAVVACAVNIDGFDADQKVVLACDVSGSMQFALSPKSKVKGYDVGLMLAMLLRTRCKQVVTGFFGNTWERLDFPSNKVLANVQEMYNREGEVGYSTNGYLVIQDLIDRKERVDKVLIFTDCQMWDTNLDKPTSFAYVWREYKKLAPQARLYLFDLQGYGKVPLDVSRPDVALIAGWSDRVFGILQAIENDSSAVEEIYKIEI